MQTPSHTGVFLVIDGTDGSGKATQTRRLLERLTAEGFEVEQISFPQYGKHSAAMTEAYLGGVYGKDPKIVGPKAASTFYAIDRFDASFQIRQWLAEGKVVVSDRYVGSNMGHQGGKMATAEERREFFHWNNHLEYEIFKIPRPNVNVVLSVPPEVCMRLAQDGAKEKTKVSGDIHEADLDHLRASYETYREITELFDEFQRIDCTDGDDLRGIEDIHQDVWSIVAPHLHTIPTFQSSTPTPTTV